MVDKVEKIVLLVNGRREGKAACTDQCGFHLGGQCTLNNFIRDVNGHPQRFFPEHDPQVLWSRECPAEGPFKVTIEPWKWLS